MTARIIEYRTSATTNPVAQGSAIARCFLNDDAQRVDLSAIGARALNNAIKGIICARRHMQEKGFDLVFIPAFAKMMVEGDEITKINISVYKTDADIHLKFMV